jgi:mono/diheme cytochrome c family protein
LESQAQTMQYSKFCAIALVVLGMFFLACCRSTPELTPQQAEGKHLYEVRCAHCHRDNDLALKKVPPDLHGLFDHQTLPSGIPATDAAVAHNILAGRGLMPGFAGRFNNEQMAALLAYLHTGLR